MTEHPIIFTADEVHAALDGRKTQIREPMRPQPTIPDPDPGVYADLYNGGPEWAFWLPNNKMTEPRTWSPPSRPGDRLWVQETWAIGDLMLTPEAFLASPEHWFFMGKPEREMLEHVVYTADHPGRWAGNWRSSTQMPRWACRLVLEVVSVRVERLQDITEHDAMYEGFLVGETTARDWFRELWNSRYARRGHPWESNDWVWVRELRRVP